MSSLSLVKLSLSPRLWVLRYREYSLVLDSRRLLLASMLSSLVALLGLFALGVSKLPISLAESLHLLFVSGAEGGFKQHILVDIRLPRILTGVFAGAALAVSGAIFQAISRNPLGSPDIIGFTAGAASGALVQIILLGGGALAVSMSAIAGGLLTALAVLALSYQAGRIERHKLVLNGIGLGAILTALNGLLLVIAKLDNAMMANFWLAGSLHARTWSHVWPLVLGCALAALIMPLFARPLSFSDLGDERARSLGLKVDLARLVMTLLAVSLAALATGATGPIAFIALAAPQLVSRLQGCAQLSIVNSALMGALLLLTADLLTQLLPTSLNLPIGRVTGIVGGLYLLWLLTRARAPRN